VAIEAADGSHDMINRVMTKDNIGLALLLETVVADSEWLLDLWLRDQQMLCFENVNALERGTMLKTVILLIVIMTDQELEH